MARTRTREGCLERLLMSELLRRSVGRLIVVFFPWVLLTELPAEELIGGSGDDATEL